MSEKPHSSSIVSGQDVSSALDKAFKQGFQDMKGADLDKTKKIFGFLEVDAGTAALIDGAWNVASSQFMELLKPKTFEIATQLGDKANLSKLTASRVAAGVVMGVNVATVGSRKMFQIAGDHKRHFHDRSERARKLAPVLDRLTGNHSVVSYMRVKQDPKDGGNEMIFADRHRLNKISDVENSNNYLSLAINIAPTVMTVLPGSRKMWNGKYDPKAPVEVPQTQSAAANANSMDTLKNTASMVAQGGVGPIANNIVARNERRLAKNLQACSALDMVMNLQEQVEYDPKSKSYQLPKEAGSKSVSLEEYIVRVMIQHQKDMADISPHHSELREALKEDLMEAAKLVAEAMRKGRIDALSLVHLVGEQKIIKNNGRAVADEDEVLGAIEKLAGVERTPHMDAKDFYANVSFTKNQFKAALKELEGEEKQRLMSLASNEVLADLGYSEKEIKEVREHTKARYDEILSNAVLGIAANDDETLKKDGMPQSQRRQLRKMETEIGKDGSDAVVTSKNGGAHALDAERLVLDHVVAKVATDKTYLGKLAEKGQSLSAANENNANDNDTHTAREDRRKATGTHNEVEM